MQCFNSENLKMRNLLLTISYDGSRFHGWQIQKNALSVQEVFQEALQKIINCNVDIKGCSRTDSGVHANMYCLSMKIVHSIPTESLVAALNRYLPKDIVVLDCQEVSEDFHARYSCKGKEYLYKVWNGRVRNPFLEGYAYHYWYPLDENLLNEAARFYIGKHDFTSFCTLDSRKMGDMVRTVEKFVVKRENDLILMYVKADGFLYNMVRIMVGTLFRVAQHKILPEQINDILLARNRQKAGPTARACGLYLNKVFY